MRGRGLLLRKPGGARWLGCRAQGQEALTCRPAMQLPAVRRCCTRPPSPASPALWQVERAPTRVCVGVQGSKVVGGGVEAAVRPGDDALPAADALRDRAPRRMQQAHRAGQHRAVACRLARPRRCRRRPAGSGPGSPAPACPCQQSPAQWPAGAGRPQARASRCGGSGEQPRATQWAAAQRARTSANLRHALAPWPACAHNIGIATAAAGHECARAPVSRDDDAVELVQLLLAGEGAVGVLLAGPHVPRAPGLARLPQQAHKLVLVQAGPGGEGGRGRHRAHVGGHSTR